MKTYFNNVESLADLKHQYRVLTLANHPDRGGSTEAMQQINAEFDGLFKIWKNRKAPTQKAATGYENDYAGATSSEYRRHVYEEYGWTGSRCKGQSNDEIKKSIRQWLKETYPAYKFNVNSRHYGCIDIYWMQADFNPFVGEIQNDYNINQFYASEDKNLNARGRDVMINVISYVQSYNYDHGDSMTDYFDRGFYESFRIGSHTAQFKIEIPKSRRTSGASDPTFIWKEGPAHQAIKKALGKDYFKEETYRTGKFVVLGSDRFYSCSDSNEAHFCDKTYSGLKTINKRMDSLRAAGILCHAMGANYMRIVFDGYTPETEAALAAEDRAKAAALKAWEEAQKEPAPQIEPEAPAAAAENEPAPAAASQPESAAPGFEVVEYSEKAIALFGDTKPIKAELKEIGGRFNPALRYGEGKRAGWIFSRKAADKLAALIAKHQAPHPAAA